MQAEFDLAHAREAKVAPIKGMSAHGELDTSRDMGTVIKAVDSSTTIPAQEPERPAEAAQRARPELRKLDRYESRPVARRDRTIGENSKGGIGKRDSLK